MTLVYFIVSNRIKTVGVLGCHGDCVMGRTLQKTLGAEFWQPGLAESPYPRKREGLDVPTDIVTGISGPGIIYPLTSLGS